MKHKGTLTALGLLAVCGWGVVVFAVYGLAHAKNAQQDYGAIVLGTAAFIGSGLLSLVWVAVVVFDWIARRAARIHAAELAAASRGPLPAGPRPAAAAPGPQLSPLNPQICQQCNTRPGEWVCTAHGGLYCAPCGAAHGTAEPGCVWRLLWEVQRQEQPRPRPVVTSPLSGVR